MATCVHAGYKPDETFLLAPVALRGGSLRRKYAHIRVREGVVGVEIDPIAIIHSRDRGEPREAPAHPHQPVATIGGIHEREVRLHPTSSWRYIDGNLRRERLLR